MFNEKKLLSILSAYKQHFPKHWEDEKYKWEAVQHFQNYWNIYAEDFAQCLWRRRNKRRLF